MQNSPGQQEYLEGNKFFMAANHLDSLPYFESAASQGNLNAVLRLARLYRGDMGQVTANPIKSQNYFRQLQGNLKWFKDRSKESSDSMLKIGAHSSSLAEEAFRIAAQEGNPRALYHLGVCCDFDHDDPHVARKYYRLAADQGDVLALHNLGICLSHLDPKEALVCHQKAAATHHARSEYQLSIYLAKGKECEPNLLLAEKYLQLSADQGFRPAQGHRFVNLRGRYHFGSRSECRAAIGKSLILIIFGNRGECNGLLPELWKTISFQFLFRTAIAAHVDNWWD